MNRKVIKDIPEMRQPKQKQEIPVGEKEPIEFEAPKLHLKFWQKNGFKTRVGAYGSIICGIMSVIPYPPIQAIGQGGIYLAGSLLLGGLGHKAIKNKKGVKEENQYKWIIDLVKLIVEYLTKKGK